MTTAFNLLGSTTLSGTASSMSVTIPAKKYLILEVYEIPTGGVVNSGITFNSDGGTNYARRSSNNGAADVTNPNQTFIETYAASTSVPRFARYFIINISNQEKMVIGHTVNQGTAGAGTAPDRDEYAYKWANTTDQITTITDTTSSNNYASGSTITVWGSD